MVRECDFCGKSKQKNSNQLKLDIKKIKTGLNFSTDLLSPF